jgi:hypothetical protein
MSSDTPMTPFAGMPRAFFSSHSTLQVDLLWLQCEPGGVAVWPVALQMCGTWCEAICLT